MRGLRTWLAAGPRPPEDTVVVLAPSPAELEAASALIEALTDGSLRVGTALFARDEAEAARLAARFPRALVRVPPPLAPAQGTLAAIRARAALGIAPDRLRGTGARLLRGAMARGVPIYALETGLQTGAGSSAAAGPDGQPPPGGIAPAPGSAAGPWLRLTLRSAVGPRPPARLAPDEAAALLASAAGAERNPRLSLDGLAGRIARRGPTGISCGMVRRIDGLDSLRGRLGAPATLLCLGNGPSSAAPEVAAFPHDALFRVNLDWRGGGVLTEPDMVFVGVKRAMRRLGAVPLGVATRRKEAALIACRLFEPWHGPAVYAVAESVAADVIPPVTGPHRPTTGAYMLAVAVALAPARLAIAGMDMFSHQAGAYAPGTDPVPGGSVNAFAPSHDAETEAAFIAACLERYAGQLIVFGPALAALVRRRCRSARFTLVEPGPAPAG